MVGNRLVRSKHAVWETMCDQWVRQCLTKEDLDAIYSILKERLDRVAGSLFSGGV